MRGSKKVPQASAISLVSMLLLYVFAHISSPAPSPIRADPLWADGWDKASRPDKESPKATVRAKPLSLNHLPSTRDGCLGAGSLEMAACQTESRWSTSRHQISLILEGLNTEISIVKPVIKGLITTFIIPLPPKTKANLWIWKWLNTLTPHS